MFNGKMISKILFAVVFTVGLLGWQSANAQGPPPPPPEVIEVTGFTAIGQLPEPTYSAPVIAAAEADMLAQYLNYSPPVGYQKVGGNGNRIGDYNLETIYESGIAVAYRCTFDFSISIMEIP